MFLRWGYFWNSRATDGNGLVGLHGAMMKQNAITVQLSDLVPTVSHLKVVWQKSVIANSEVMCVRRRYGRVRCWMFSLLLRHCIVLGSRVHTIHTIIYNSDTWCAIFTLHYCIVCSLSVCPVIYWWLVQGVGGLITSHSDGFNCRIFKLWILKCVLITLKSPSCVKR